MNRRRFLAATGLSAAAWSLRALPAAAVAPIRVSMCDWNLGPAADPSTLAKAAAVGLDGVQVSVATDPGHVPLREPAVRQQYLELGKRHGLTFNSVAAGGILNQIPLASEPQAAVYVIEAVEAAAALGAKNILIAFFSNGDLRLQDATGEHRNTSDGPFRSYELDARGVTRVVEALRQIAPRAEDLGVVLGMENTLTAVQNLEILDRVGSPMVQVYYDIGNSTAYGYDVPTELRLLGNDRICELHIKETLTLRDPAWGLLDAPAEGIDFAAVSAAVRDIGFDKWFVLETSGREGRFEEDTRTNIAFVRRTFG